MKGIERGDGSNIGQIRSQFCHCDLSDLLAFFNSLREIKKYEFDLVLLMPNNFKYMSNKKLYAS
jgi:hypothetical protein